MAGWSVLSDETLCVVALVTALLLFRALHRPAVAGSPPRVPPRTGFNAGRAEALGKLDAIVIGSGPGGLATAAMLARRGKVVLVLEANEALGGGMHTWEDNGCTFETGFHYLGEVHCAAGPLRRIIDYVAPGVSWAAMADCPHAHGIYDEVFLGGVQPVHLTLRPGELAWTSELCRAFPGEEAAVQSFLELCKKSAGAFLPGVIWRSLASPTLSCWLKRVMTAGLRTYQSQTVQQALEKVTSDARLVGALSYIMCGCCGVGPRDGSFSALAGVTCHFMQGGAYPHGGAAAVVGALVHTVEASGGAAYVRAPVEAIVLDASGRAIGVRMKRGGLELRAPVVVSAIGAQLTLEELLPCPGPPSLPALAAAQRQCAASGLTRTRGHLNLFLTIEGSTEELRLPRHNTWIFPTPDHDAQFATLEAMQLAHAVETLAQPWTYVGMAFPSAKDPDWATDGDGVRAGVSSAVVIAEVPTGWWSEWAGTRVHHRGIEYEAIKGQLEMKLTALLVKRFPQLQGRIKSSNLGTPLSTTYYMHKREGESYGFQPTPNFFRQQEEWLRPSIRGLDGLHLAGQDVNFDGFAGALLSGIMCAASIEGPLLWMDVVRAIGLKALLSDLCFGGEDLSQKYSSVKGSQGRDQTAELKARARPAEKHEVAGERKGAEEDEPTAARKPTASHGNGTGEEGIEFHY